MEDKQIIIDGVNVAECEHFEPCTKYTCEISEMTYCCEEDKNCYYKQLKRKEQECEELKYELILKDVANIELSDEVKKYRKAIDEIEEIADNNCEIAKMEQIFLIIGGLDV